MQQSEARYRAIFEHPAEFAIVIEAVRNGAGVIQDWIYVDANRNALSLLNETLDSLLGKRLSEVLPDRAERLMEICSEVMAERSPHHYETSTGTTDFLVCLYPMDDNTIIGSGIDVTARNQAKREVQRLLDALRAEKEWLFAVLNSINEEVYFTDPQKRYTYANPAAMREFGHASVEGVPVERIVSDLTVLRADGSPRPIEEAPPLRALAGEVIRNEEQIVRIPRTGEYRHRQVSSAPVRNAENNIIGSVSVVRDITESKQAEARLRKAVEQAQAAEAESRAALAAELAAMKRLHELSTIAMTTNDQQALLEEILDATIALHAADFGSVRLFDAQSGKLSIAAHRGFDAPLPEELLAVEIDATSPAGLALVRGERVVIEDIEADPTGSARISVARELGCRALQSTPLFTTAGTPLGVLSTQFRLPRRFSQNELRLTDLYARQAGIAIERKRAEAELIAAHEAADRANKTKSHFVRSASHDLRQSVQTLAVLNGTLRTLVLDEIGRTAVRQQGQAIDTMAQLLNALLNISKLESGGVRPEVSDFSVTSLFEKLRLEFSTLADAKGLELRIDAPSAQAARSDPTLVGEILRNLLSNAVKFTPAGSITMRCVRNGSAVRLEVLDTGVGIPREELPLIFGEFYQVGVDATGNRQGFGLGLGIVQRMATLLQAGVEVESEIGKGSRFSVTVPAGDVELAERSERSTRDVARSRVTSATLLLVEDDPSVRASMELFFKACGYRIVSAASLEQALALPLGESRPDMLITDFHLPGGKTGSDVIRSVREVLGSNFPAIMISGDTSSEIEDLPEGPHLRFASKPVEPARLIALVQELLANAGTAPRSF